MGSFFDAADGGPLRLELRSVDGHDFRLLRRIGYRSEDHERPFVVPDDLDTFHTDLASVPWVLTWLVPKSGGFLPAAVLHDGMVRDEGYRGPRVERAEADRIFRGAMVELGTGRVRAWLMWSAVTLVTMWRGHGMASRVLLVGLLGLVAVLGLIATVDVLDLWNVLPWMGQRPTGQELVGGALAAIVIPMVLALSWGRFWAAGAITGTALALLLHVTVAVAAIYGLYLVVERVVSGPRDERGLRLRRPRRRA